mgnify:CR=1 FL=1
MVAKRRKSRAPLDPEGFHIGGVQLEPGTVSDVELDMARLPTRTKLTLPVRVVRGASDGPCMWLSAGIHGDELIGIEVIRQVLEQVEVARLCGTIIAVPIVNLHGFLIRSRYLPDGRDLNRSFPGGKRGSLAARLAHLFMEEIVSKCQYGIDFHTATNDRVNLPQLRVDLGDDETRELARAFGAPVTIDARLRDGSLREVATQRGVRVLLFEGGEAQRFDTAAIAIGVRGVQRVLARLGMHPLPPLDAAAPVVPAASRIATRCAWIRAPRSGLFRCVVENGQDVERGARLGVIANVFGEDAIVVKAKNAGTVVSLALNPVVHQGDAILRLAFTTDAT